MSEALGRIRAAKNGLEDSLNLSGGALEELPEEIGTVVTLTRLDVSHNDLGALPGAVGLLPRLRELNVSHNRLCLLPGELSLCTSLRHLRASGNHFSALPSLLPGLPALLGLHLQANQLASLPPLLARMTGLTELHLDHNQLRLLPGELGGLRGLRVLGLACNRLLALPPSLLALPRLTTLRLQGNLLCSLSPSIPASLSSLTLLDVTNNPLQQPLIKPLDTRELILHYFEGGGGAADTETKLGQLERAFPRMTWEHLSHVLNEHFGNLEEAVEVLREKEAAEGSRRRSNFVEYEKEHNPMLAKLAELFQASVDFPAEVKRKGPLLLLPQSVSLELCGASVNRQLLETHLLLPGEGGQGCFSWNGKLRGRYSEDGQELLVSTESAGVLSSPEDTPESPVPDAGLQEAEGWWDQRVSILRRDTVTLQSFAPVTLSFALISHPILLETPQERARRLAAIAPAPVEGSSGQQASSSASLPHASASASGAACAGARLPAVPAMSFPALWGSPELRRVRQNVDKFARVLLRKRPPQARVPKAVDTFLYETEQTLFRHPLWAEATEQDILHTRLELQKYLLARIYEFVFKAPEPLLRDERMHEWLKQLQWVGPEHLEIPAELRSERLWEVASRELRMMNDYVTPSQKLECICTCCRVVNFAINNAGTAISADDFLPCLIMVVLRARPRWINCNLSFIEQYSGAEALDGEAFYYYTSVFSAASFLERLDHTSLRMDEEAFERMVKGEEPRPQEAVSGQPPQERPRALTTRSIRKRAATSSLHGRGPSSPSSPSSSSSRSLFLRAQASSLPLLELPNLLLQYQELFRRIEGSDTAFMHSLQDRKPAGGPLRLLVLREGAPPRRPVLLRARPSSMGPVHHAILSRFGLLDGWTVWKVWREGPDGRRSALKNTSVAARSLQDWDSLSVTFRSMSQIDRMNRDAMASFPDPRPRAALAAEQSGVADVEQGGVAAVEQGGVAAVEQGGVAAVEQSGVAAVEESGVAACRGRPPVTGPHAPPSEPPLLAVPRPGDPDLVWGPATLMAGEGSLKESMGAHIPDSLVDAAGGSSSGEGP